MEAIFARDANERTAGPLTIYAMAGSAVKHFLSKPHAAGAWAGRQGMVAPLVPTWLDEAIKDLERVDDEARKEGFRAINPVAKLNARHILESVRLAGLPSPSVYPTEDQEVAILFASEAPGAVVLSLCDSHGGGAYFASIGGKNRRARFDDATDIPRPFLIEELRNLRAAR
jgi:hypothetical protein